MAGTVAAMTDLTTRRLGRSGLAVSTVGLGANNFGLRIDAAESRKVVDAALDAGVTLIDTSDSYGDSELVLGEILEGRRDEVVLATKFGSPRHLEGTPPNWGATGSRRYIRQAVERSLRRLRTDHIDLYQQHCPDPETPIEETLGALDELVHEGKVRYVGSSNFAAWQLADAAWTADDRRFTPFVSAQNHWNLFERDIERELVPAAERFGVGILPYFPLASGLLTGKYRRGQAVPENSRVAAWGLQDRLTDERFDVLEALEAFARERGTTLLGVAIGWLAAQPSVASVIAGATRPEQVTANVAVAAWVPTTDDLVEIDRITGHGD
jgi:aryl-alcohol dehydrogenase-like predicted oxidoreductase